MHFHQSLCLVSVSVSVKKSTRWTDKQALLSVDFVLANNRNTPLSCYVEGCTASRVKNPQLSFEAKNLSLKEDWSEYRR